MNWNELYFIDQVPSFDDIETFIGETKAIWYELISHIEYTYKVKPKLDYSKCSAQPGWNVKYKKSSRSLCTLYPMPNYFIALVVVGQKEEEEVKLAVEAKVFSDYVSELYLNTPFSAMGKWLMIEVKGKEVLNDIKELIEIRMGSK